jgi:hypothetical protein
MQRLIILSTPDGEDGDAEPIGDVDASGFTCDERRRTGSFGLRGSHELMKVLSEGYTGDWALRPFHVQQGDRLVESCHVLGQDSCIHFEFLGRVVQSDAL